ncbi:type I restriction endonuclease subunit R [Oscillatoriales cyanobacterium LEGE 11467]|uniref:Type I restriction endonuclease subunit R n=1 Tax=Zarconia navalis LEGE 11467 TaxID=1828826 RepID=A0A928Z5X2_9CYAN|nr:type I restriction endonuclease subunit R [Zarconia navalis]MBE9039757.1 type I restriction endonuclease subunit R [Zarconia navalis LEGE 11467]
MMTFAVTETVKSIHQAESLLGLTRIPDESFFSEWRETLSSLTPTEEATLDRVKASYLYNSADGPLSESTINLLLVSPLLYLSGFCDPPFKVRSEMSVEISARDGKIDLKGRIDALVLHDRIWLILVESKQAKFSFSMAIPQALAYMMGSPNGEHPIFGLVTNGDGFLFIKLVKKPRPLYALSDDFSLFRQSRNELYEVLKILKKLGTLA